MHAYVMEWHPEFNREKELAQNKRIYGEMTTMEFYDSLYMRDRKTDRERLDEKIDFMCAEITQRALIDGMVTVSWFGIKVTVELQEIDKKGIYRIDGYSSCYVDRRMLFDKLRDQAYQIIDMSMDKYYKTLSFESKTFGRWRSGFEIEELTKNNAKSDS